MEGLTACSSTATTRRASGLVMPLARISGGTLGEASSGVGVFGFTSTRPPPSASDHSSRRPETVDAVGRDDDLELVLRVAGVPFVGVGEGLE